MTLNRSDTRVSVAHDEAQTMVDFLRTSISKKMDEPGTDGSVDRLIHKWWFDAIVNVAIALNTIQLGLETDHPQMGWLWFIFENVFTTIFLLEMSCKLWVLRCEYFNTRWHWLDFFLVIIAMVDCWILVAVTDSSDLDSLSALRILRMLRMMRFLKLFRRFRQFVLVVESIMDAAKSCVSVAIVLCLTVYVFAIFTVKMVGQGPVEKYPGYTSDDSEIAHMEVMVEFNPHLSFGSIHRAMLTLFNIVMLTEWTDVIKPLLFYQPWLVPIFVVFALFTTLGIMNVIVGMICDGVLAKAREENAEKEKRLHEEKLTLLERVNDILKSMDHNSDGRVDAQELEQAMSSDPSVAQLIALAQLPEGFGAEELIMMLDNDGDGWLSYAEFLRSFYRLIDGGEFQRLCLMQANINAVKQMVVRVLHSTTGLNDRFQALEDRLVTHSGQGNCLEMRALAATNEPEQPMDLARQLNTVPSDAFVGVQGHHWREALASLRDVSNTIRLELSHGCLDVMPDITETVPSASLQNTNIASDRIIARLSSNSLIRSSPAVLPRPSSRESIEPGLACVPQAGMSAWSHSCEHSLLPKLRD